jgi:hypothetical protein
MLDPLWATKEFWFGNVALVIRLAPHSASGGAGQKYVHQPVCDGVLASTVANAGGKAGGSAAIQRTAVNESIDYRNRANTSSARCAAATPPS